MRTRENDNNTILISRYHVHSGHWDRYFKIDIFMLLTTWLVALCAKRIKVSR